VADTWQSFTTDDELVAPGLLLAECTSVLTRQVYRRSMRSDSARDQLQKLLLLPVRTVESRSQYVRAYEIARSLGWAKAYDAIYLATADNERSELLTLDRGLYGAAARLGIPAALIAS
jgi:predicted nucleic acid-binding protein